MVFVPEEMLLGTLIPIPRNKRKSVNESSNYRGITLSSIIGKLYDFILFKMNNMMLRSSNLQFGFKENHSTSMCTFVFKEVSQYYINKGSYVHCMMIDASQAFDRVEYVKLFTLLLMRGLCPIVARFLVSCYTQQKLRIKWGNSMSNAFSVKNGVKQGGVLSPFLFAVYMDALLQKLEKLGFGCYVGNKFMGAIAYADDVAILAPSVTSLKLMLKAVAEFGCNFAVKFNPSKSIYVILGKKLHKSHVIYFNGVAITSTNAADHLGHSIGCKSQENHILKMNNDFVKRFNLMMSVFRHCPVSVKYRLFKTYCLSLYGCVLWEFSCDMINKFYVCWRKCMRQLIGLSQRAHGGYLHKVVDDISIENQLIKRFVKFYNKVICSENPVVQLCCSLVNQGSNSTVCRSLNYVRNKFSITTDKKLEIPHDKIVNLMKENDCTNDDDVFNICCIKDVINLRENNNVFSKAEINTMLDYFSIK